MTIELSELMPLVGLFFFTFTRISTFVMTVPVIGTKLVQTRVRLILAVAITIVVMPIVSKGQYPKVDLVSFEAFLILMSQFIIGLAMGLVLQIVFQIFILLGEMVSMQSGLGFAILNDPAGGSSVPMVGQFYLMIITLLFLLLEGHLAVFEVLIKSFTILPLSIKTLELNTFQQIVNLGNWMFTSAFKMALPGITALLVFQTSVGIMTKAAPQINIFTIGFPLGVIVGIIVIWGNIGMILPHFITLYEKGISFIQVEMLKGPIDG